MPKHFAFSSLTLMLFLTSNMAYAVTCGSGSTVELSATACGTDSKAIGYGSVAIGNLAETSKSGSIATGLFAKATGESSIATGARAEAVGMRSIATGSGARAPGDNSLALGAYSRAENDNELNIGYWESQSDGYKQVLTRTLSGVAEGMKDDQAVNKAQLDKAARQTLQSANDHSEQRAVVAENNAVTRAAAYTDNSATVTLEKANSYTNNRAAATLEKANNYSNQRAVQAENNAVTHSNRYTNRRVNALKQQVDRNEKRANGGIAGAMAMSAITGNGSGFGMAISSYRDQGAIAAGIQKSLTPDTSVNLKATWDSGNGVGVAAGFFTSW